jgi:hypothetical protein
MVQPCPQPTPKTRRRPEQTCDDEELDRLQAEKDQLANAIPPFDPAVPDSRNPKRLARAPCSRIKQRLRALEALLAKRWEIQNTCFGGKPDQPHQNEISAVERAIKRTTDLEAINCAKGHPMAEW